MVDSEKALAPKERYSEPFAVRRSYQTERAHRKLMRLTESSRQRRWRGAGACEPDDNLEKFIQSTSRSIVPGELR